MATIEINTKLKGELPPVTAREREILNFMAEGFADKEIAQLLGIALMTVKNHKHRLFEKLNVESTVRAIRCFYDFVPKTVPNA